MNIIFTGKPGKTRAIKLIPSCGAEHSWLENLEKELNGSSMITIGMLKEDGIHRGFCIDFVTVGKPNQIIDKSAELQSAKKLATTEDRALHEENDRYRNALLKVVGWGSDDEEDISEYELKVSKMAFNTLYPDNPLYNQKTA